MSGFQGCCWDGVLTLSGVSGVSERLSLRLWRHIRAAQRVGPQAPSAWSGCCGWQRAAGALLPSPTPTPPGAAPREAGVLGQAGEATAPEPGAVAVAVMAGGGVGRGTEDAAWARASLRGP